MDATQFDRLARSLGARAARRRVLVGLLAGLGTVPAVDLVAGSTAGAKSKRRRAVKGEAKRQDNPFPGLRDCPNPGPGKNLSKCNFVGKDLRGKKLSGSNLSGASFAFANLCSADLRGANLNKTDFTGAVLTRVDFRGTKLSSAILNDAVLCQTQLPDGRLENRGCPPDADDVCCDDAECGEGTVCDRGVCGGPPGSGNCVAMGDICTVLVSECCEYNVQGVCTLTLAPGVSSCQVHCNTDADCVRKTGSPDVFCAQGANCLFPFAKCCFRKHTRNPKECSSGSSCLVSQTVYECCLLGETCSVVGYGCV